MLVAVCGVVAVSCASEDKDSASSDSAKKAKVCQVTDTGGVNDKSFNQTANDGVVKAEKDLGVDGKVLESKSDADYVPNIQTFTEQNCDLIVPVGFLLDQATQDRGEGRTRSRSSPSSTTTSTTRRRTRTSRTRTSRS